MATLLLPEPVISGYLEKRSGGLLAKWENRLFEVRGHYLRYYDTARAEASDTSIKAVMDLAQLLHVEQTADKGDSRLVVLRVTFKEDTSLAAGGGGGQGGVVKLRAPTVEDARAWAEVLHGFVEGNARRTIERGHRITDGRRELYAKELDLREKREAGGAGGGN